MQQPKFAAKAKKERGSGSTGGSNSNTTENQVLFQSKEDNANHINELHFNNQAHEWMATGKSRSARVEDEHLARLLV